MKETNRANMTERGAFRYSNIELLRIIIMIMIVGTHFATHGEFVFDNARIELPRLWISFLELGVNLGVDVFVMISGYFLISNTSLILKLGKIGKLWGCIFTYSLLLFVVSIGIGYGTFGLKELIKALFPITFESWWFASTYFVLYLLHPFLNLLLRMLPKSDYRKFISILVIIWSLIPTFTNMSFQSNKLLEFIMIYAIAAYIKLYGLNVKWTTKHYLIAWAVLSGITYLSCIVLLLIGVKIQAASAYPFYFYRRTSVLTILRAICFFMAFLNMKVKYHWWINKIASATFGVYLLHDSEVLRSFFWKTLFRNADFQNSNYLILYSISAILCVYVLCTVIELLRQYIFETTIMKCIFKKLNLLLCNMGKNIEARLSLVLKKTE